MPRLYLHRTIVSMALCSALRGYGQLVHYGDILVTTIDGSTNTHAGSALYAVNSTTGERRIVSGAGVGTGANFANPTNVVTSSDGAIYVFDQSGGPVYQIDPLTGNRTMIDVTAGEPEGWAQTGVAAIDAQGRILFPSVQMTLNGGNSTEYKGVVRLTPLSGVSEIVSGKAEDGLGGIYVRGSGAEFIGPTAVAFSASGSLLAIDKNLHALVQIDPATGNRTILSQEGDGKGPGLAGNESDLDIRGNEAFITSFTGYIYKADLTTGERSLWLGPYFSPFVPYAGLSLCPDGTAIIATRSGLVHVSADALEMTPLSGSPYGVHEYGSGDAFTGHITSIARYGPTTSVPEPASSFYAFAVASVLIAFRFLSKKIAGCAA
ncbi:MAG: hypothetical protein NTV51_17015 [Verrucomicrobia bacterium]|nr:hypothetical protein [Verrucomicrobiota bacterium]